MTASETPTAQPSFTETATASATWVETTTPTPTAWLTETPTATLIETPTTTVTPFIPTPTTTPFAARHNFAQSNFLFSGESITVSVNNITDLIDQINVAQTDENCSTVTVINLNPGEYKLTGSSESYYGGNGLPVIHYRITINGNNQTISRTSSQDYRIFAVNPYGVLTINNLTISNGKAGEVGGSGIFVLQGQVILNDSIVSGNTLSIDGPQVLGAGIYNFYGNLKIQRSVISNNQNTVGLADGGGVGVIGGTTLIQSSILQNNTAFRDGGGLAVPLSPAGLTVQNSAIIGNLAHRHGGGIYSGGQDVTLTQNLIQGNNALNQGGGMFGERFGYPQTVYNGCILSNANTSVYAVSTDTIDARNNWWGSASGPAHPSNPGGTGDSANANVVILNINGTPDFKPSQPTDCTQGTTPMPTPTPVPTATPTPSFTGLNLYGSDISLQGVMFWVTFWETISDSSDSGTASDNDLNARYTDFLQQSPYCSIGSNPPSDNAAEGIIVQNPLATDDPFWLYIRHCPQDHRFMFARTMMNGFLNYERRSVAPFNYILANNSSVVKDANSNPLWKISPCEDQSAIGGGKSFNIALSQNIGARWLYGYMVCVGTNPNVNLTDVATNRIRRAYTTTIFPQIQQAISNFYSPASNDVTTGDPTYGAFSNLDANLNGDSYLTCAGGCYLNNANRISGVITYVFRATQVNSDEFSFVKLASNVSSSDISSAYAMHIQQQVLTYVPGFSSVIQPVLRREYDRDTGVLTGYLWTTRIYRRSDDMRHFPRWQN